MNLEASPPPRVKRRSIIVLWLTTGVHITVAAILILGGAITVAALAKLIWRAASFGWNIWT